jgi:glycosyltransferase involved in cell wall biosynthesis
VVDDGSRDGSREYIEKRADCDPRIVPIFLGENAGISGARNAGIEVAKGEFISIIDSDDRFFPDTISQQLEAFQRISRKTPNLSLLTSDAWLINERGQRKGRYISREWWGRETAVDPPLWTLPSTFFFRRDRSARFFPDYKSADAPIFIRRMEQIGPVGFLGKPLIEYRLRMSSVTNQKGAQMLREMNAAAHSCMMNRLDAPFTAAEVDPPDWRDLAVWIHGRNAKNAAVNGKWVIALSELIKSSFVRPSKSFERLWRSLKSIK